MGGLSAGALRMPDTSEVGGDGISSPPGHSYFLDS
ncbi:Uncharacterised protein [Shigella sonnei]|nr:Uncharacterised protein [Shigella sonnei]CST40520.1 Uncharacterised protein [Shigella sonnei]